MGEEWYNQRKDSWKIRQKPEIGGDHEKYFAGAAEKQHRRRGGHDPAGTDAGAGAQPVHPVFVRPAGDRPAGDGADLYPGVVRQAAGRVPCVVSDPGASAGGAGAVAAEQSCIGDRSDPVQLCGGAAVSRGHRPSGSGESDAGGVAPVVDRSGPGRPDPGAGGRGALQSLWHYGGPYHPHRPVPGV